ncbi:hypothetical protein LINGRAHAP2_LOCUS21367 [Linum grandiflorum]|jgi:hypothetical protein
MVAV